MPYDNYGENTMVYNPIWYSVAQHGRHGRRFKVQLPSLDLHISQERMANLCALDFCRKRGGRHADWPIEIAVYFDETSPAPFCRKVSFQLEFAAGDVASHPKDH